ncbi:glucan 1,3-beta-glucosidase [Martiniozyma asiatica (nom. inval.)]|nr:glucan 1,3-beta-glucosidase [Martiniozyma asiatica]
MKILSLLSLITLACAAPLILQKRNSRWDYSSDKIYGVNIGGWLVLEPFITPSLFEAFGGDDSTKPVDEYHLCETYGYEQAETVLQEHWSTWIVEQDFKDMSDAGLNFVRIPVGYWAFQLADGDPYVQGQEAYLDKALAWCAQYGLKAWIDLHGVPGSQNGFDNSGIRDQIKWQTTDGYIDITINVLTTIASKYSADEYKDVVIGIELVNEPLGPDLDASLLIDYYEKGYEIVRNYGDVPVIIHDAFFQLNHYWDNILNTEQDPNIWDVYVDHHHYQIFSVGELQRSLDDKISFACNLGKQEAEEYHIDLCGEWTAALTDCGKWLNGLNRGARWDATFDNTTPIGSCDHFYLADYSYFQQEDVRTTYRKYVEAQMDAYTHSKMMGWVFWCWKTENLIEWDFKQLLSLNIIPQPLDSREFYNQCQY